MNKILAALTFVLLFSFSAQSQTALDDQAKPLVASFKGKVSLFAKNLDTGETYGLNPDERVRIDILRHGPISWRPHNAHHANVPEQPRFCRTEHRSMPHQSM